jgi:glycosyltransferase involved in cell wall biosynthesis
VISLIIPVYNEEQVLAVFIEALMPIIKPLNQHFELIFVNDGSDDATLLELLRLQADRQDESLRINIIDLSRNFGKEAALMAGIRAAKGEAVIPIDVDLQDPPELIVDMLTCWEAGSDVVLAKRICRRHDGFFKRTLAGLFYRIHNSLSHLKLEKNVGDYRLMDRKVVDVIKGMPEKNLFMKGVFFLARL